MYISKELLEKLNSFDLLIGDLKEFAEKDDFDSAKKVCDYFLKMAKSNFSKEKSLKYLQEIIAPHKEKYSGKTRDKTYADIMNNGGGVPTNEKLIQICFDFSIREHKKIDELFSACYRPHLYLKDKEDAAYYFLLTNENVRALDIANDYKLAKKWIEDNITGVKKANKARNAQNDRAAVGIVETKYTANYYNELEAFDSLEELIDFLNNDIAFTQQTQNRARKNLGKAMRIIGEKKMSQELGYYYECCKEPLINGSKLLLDYIEQLKQLDAKQGLPSDLLELIEKVDDLLQSGNVRGKKGAVESARGGIAAAAVPDEVNKYYGTDDELEKNIAGIKYYKQVDNWNVDGVSRAFRQSSTEISRELYTLCQLFLLYEKEMVSLKKGDLNSQVERLVFFENIVSKLNEDLDLAGFAALDDNLLFDFVVQLLIYYSNPCIEKTPLYFYYLLIQAIITILGNYVD